VRVVVVVVVVVVKTRLPWLGSGLLWRRVWRRGL
jgi:hypothetical protein